MERMKEFVKRFYVVIILLLIYIPLFVVVAVSFNPGTAKGDINVTSYTTATGDNYVEMFNDDDFWSAFSNTIFIALIVVPVSVGIAIMAVLGVRRAKSGYQRAVLATSNVQIVNPDVITAVALATLMASTWIPLGLPKGFASIILAHISFCTPYAIIAIYPRAVKLQENWLLASKDLGYTPLRTFWKITVPFLMPAVLTGAAIAFAMSFDDFIITRLVGGKVQTLATQMYAMSKGIKTWVASFGSLIVVLTIVIVGIVLAFSLRKGGKRAARKAVLGGANA